MKLCMLLGGLGHQNEAMALPTVLVYIGRTGTLITIGIALEQAAQEKVVDIPAIVTKMRRQRMKMVQNSVREVNI